MTDDQLYANVPANASTTCTGSMEDQNFGYYDSKPLNPTAKTSKPATQAYDI